MASRIPGSLGLREAKLAIDRGTLQLAALDPPGPTMELRGAKRSPPHIGSGSLATLSLDVLGVERLKPGPKAAANTEYFVSTEWGAAPVFIEAKLKPPGSQHGENDKPTWSGGTEHNPREGVNDPLERMALFTAAGKQTVSCRWHGLTKTVVIYAIDALQTGFKGDGGAKFSPDNLPLFTAKTAGRRLPDPKNTQYLDLCESQFTVRPPEFIADGENGVFQKAQVRFQVHREIDGRTWFKILKEDGTESDWISSAKVGSGWRDDNPSTDDVNRILEPWPASGHLYANDGPGSLGGPAFTLTQKIVQIENFRQWVLVSLDGSDPAHGIQISQVFFWHHFRSLARSGGSPWREEPTFGGNELLSGPGTPKSRP
jgi:hypothetical protein